jgi:single-stranded-DNA-specific exonuclease
MTALLKERPAGAGTTEGPFLGVAVSARGFAWRERLEPGAAALATTISQRHAIPELLGRVLAARGVAVADVPVFLDPSLKALMPDPSTLRDMDKAAARLADAIQSGERIAVFGDYDVDGACSSALLARFLAHHGTRARIYIPDRIFEGYGPNVAAIEALVAEGARLIVTVDCGTTSFEPLAAARRLGADVAVVDHHQADERLPDVAALVNPNRQDDLSGQGHLCAAGVTFLVLVATARELRRRGHYAKGTPEPNLLDSLDLVALATVADVVPLKGLTAPTSPRGCRSCAAAATPGSRRCSTPPAWRRRRRLITSASSSARASMPAGASATRGSARACSPQRTRWRRRASPCCSTSSTTSARRSRRACSRRPSPRPTGSSTRPPNCRC